MRPQGVEPCWHPFRRRRPGSAGDGRMESRERIEPSSNGLQPLYLPENRDK